MQFETAWRGGARYTRRMLLTLGVLLALTVLIVVGRRASWSVESVQLGYVSERWLAEYRVTFRPRSRTVCVTGRAS